MPREEAHERGGRQTGCTVSQEVVHVDVYMKSMRFTTVQVAYLHALLGSKMHKIKTRLWSWMVTGNLQIILHSRNSDLAGPMGFEEEGASSSLRTFLQEMRLFSSSNLQILGQQPPLLIKWPPRSATQSIRPVLYRDGSNSFEML